MQVKHQLWPHQLDVFKRIEHENNFALFCEVGTGKTAISVKKVEHLTSTHNIYRTLIVCPKSVCEAWSREFYAFTDLGDKAIVISDMVRAKKIKLINDDRYNIHIINYDSVAPLIDELPQYDIIILDESHWIKGPNTKRTKALLQISKHAKFKYILSGTPIVHSEFDIFSQFKFLDGGKSFGENFFSFRGKYFVDKNQMMRRDKYFPNWQPRDGTREKILEIMSAKSISLKKIDCLKSLPPKVYKILDCDMGSDQNKAYQEMKKDLITYINDNAATAMIALTKAERLLQIASGFVKLEDDTIHRFQKVPKFEVLMEQIESLSKYHKIIIWAKYIENLDRIYAECDKMGLLPSRLYGDHSSQHEIDRFQRDSNVRVMVANPASGGTGITLTQASVSIYYSNGFNFAHREQSEGRPHRIGSEVHSSITYIDLITEGTIEREVYEVLKQRKDFAEVILSLKG